LSLVLKGLVRTNTGTWLVTPSCRCSFSAARLLLETVALLLGFHYPVKVLCRQTLALLPHRQTTPNYQRT